jgi:collagen type V/XI/XXIV/XXVII alpha
VDPNLGMAEDAVKVYCNLTSGETCVFPDVHASRMPNIPWRKSNNGGGWFSGLRGGFKVNTTQTVPSAKHLQTMHTLHL